MLCFPPAPNDVRSLSQNDGAAAGGPMLAGPLTAPCWPGLSGWPIPKQVCQPCVQVDVQQRVTACRLRTDAKEVAASSMIHLDDGPIGATMPAPRTSRTSIAAVHFENVLSSAKAEAASASQQRLRVQVPTTRCPHALRPVLLGGHCDAFSTHERTSPSCASHCWHLLSGSWSSGVKLSLK